MISRATLNRRHLLTSAAALAGLVVLDAPKAFAALNITLTSHFEVVRFIDHNMVEVQEGRDHQTMRVGDVFRDHTLVAIVVGEAPFAVLEDFTTRDGNMLIVDTTGVRHTLTKTAEATAIDYSRDTSGLSREQADLLGSRMRSLSRDPQYDDVAAAFQPIRAMSGVYNFIGTPGWEDTVVFAYGGRSAGFDPAGYHPSVASTIAAGKVLDGLVGGYLPILRFVYPDDNGDWTEFLAFAPFNQVSNLSRVRYRVTRVEGRRRVWSRHFDTRRPGGTVENDEAEPFYADVDGLKVGWDQALAGGMKVDVPDQRMADQARHSLVRLLMGTGGEGGNEALYGWGLGGSGKESPDAYSQYGKAILGLPQIADGEVAGAASADYGYLLVKIDSIAECLQTTYSGMAHHYTRGMWLAPATRKLFADVAGAYDRDAQGFCPLMMRWLLAFEEPDSEVLWLGKGMPRQWFESEKITLIDDVPTRWGRISFATDSDRKREHRIAARIVFPAGGLAAETRLRLRSHDQAPMRSVRVNGKSWPHFDATSETITLPPGMGGEVLINAWY